MPNHDRFECQTAIDSDAILHLSGILDDYKTGVITQIQAVGRIGNVFSALESGDSKKVVHLLTEGRKLLRTG
ncbi:hypothetical protein E4Z89_23980 (plasmid) [Escherichia coli]|nr:hypothetical protein E4Z89_23980 [Escherichia coli]